MGRIKYCHDLSKQEYREFKQFCRDEQQKNLLPPAANDYNINAELILSKGSSGIILGKSKEYEDDYVGVLQGQEGHALIVGGSGSGKSSGICKPTISMWKGAFCATDIKCELSKFYQALYQQKLVTRPFIKFDPMQESSPGYDPFSWLSKDGAENLVNNIWEIVVSIIPLSFEEKEPFWTQSEQAIFAAALHYYYQQNLNFNEILLTLLGVPLSELIRNITESNNTVAKIYIGEMTKMKAETLFSIDRGLRNKLIPFATNPYIQGALRSKNKGDDCFDWDDLEHSNIFLCIPEDRIEEFGSLINLMYSQLIKHLERRPDKYSLEGKKNIPVLILFDEFARFGTLSVIANAVATLRSKCVNICLILQSLAQLDKFYGKNERRIIVDNCQYIAILGANDLDTQKYFNERIGTQKSFLMCHSENTDEFGDIIGYSKQSSETRSPMIYSHEFATLNDVIILSPYGICRAEKIRPDFEKTFIKNNMVSKLLDTQITVDDSSGKNIVKSKV